MLPKTLYVGVDVSEASFEVCFIDQDERKLAIHSYPNIPEGFRRLRVDSLAFSSLLGKRVPIVFGMESTGNYHKNLEKFLRDRRSKRFTVRVLNPYRIKEFRKAHFKLSKTDRIDSFMIAKFLKAFPSDSSFFPSSQQFFIRSLTRFRRTLIEERTRCINRLRKNLRVLFPGYKRILGEKLKSDFLRFISLHQTPEDFPSFHPSFRRFLPLFGLLQDRRMLQLLRNEVKWTAERIIQLNEQIEEVEEEIERIMDTHYPDHILFSIPGIGKVTVATVIGEIGDSVERFPSKKDFIGYIGLYPVVYQSGKNRTFFRMTWKGNKWLKMAFILATASGRRSNPAFRNFYNRLRERGKSKKAAGETLPRKIASLVYTILCSGKPWNGNVAFQGIQRGNGMAERSFPRIVREESQAGRLTFHINVSQRAQRLKDNPRSTRPIQI